MGIDNQVLTSTSNLITAGERNHKLTLFYSAVMEKKVIQSLQ